MIHPGRLRLLALLNGGVCMAAGVSYLAVSPTELNTTGLVTAGALGGAALIAAGIWIAEETRKPVARLVLGILAGAFAIASSAGLWGAQVAREARLEPTGLPSALHIAGVVLGVALVVAVLFRSPAHDREAHS